MNIAPSYQCNLYCPFCFNQEFWKNKDILSLSDIEKEIWAIKEISELSIIGGEPTCLPDDYLSDLLKLCADRLNGKKPTIFTNLVKPFKFVDLVGELNVSYDPYDRREQSKVLANLMSLDAPYIINMILTKNLVTKMDPYRFIRFSERIRHKIHLDVLGNIETNHISHMVPEPDEIIRFLDPIIKENNPYIKFYPLEFFKGTQKKQPSIAERFQKDLTLTADKKYLITNADLTDANYGAKLVKIKYDTYEEAKNAFFEMCQLPSKCDNCRYKHNCIGNKYIMESLERLMYEYHPELSV